MSYRKPLPGGGLPQSHQRSRAGAGLGSAQARQRFGDQAEVGASGERYFAQILHREAFDAYCDIFYSLGIPQGKDSSAKVMTSDVDVVLMNGNRIVLVDVKRWKGSHFYWSLGGLPFRGTAPLMHNGKWKLSANMAAAQRRYREALPGMGITSMVVFVPTYRGAAPTSVKWLKWPGGINSYQVNGAVKELRSRLGTVREAPPARAIGLLNRLER